MGESTNIIASLSKMRLVGYIVAILGVGLFFEGVADLVWVAYNVSNLEPYLESALYLVADFAFVISALALWVVSAKILRAKA
jgi:hypothetical protein